MNDPRPSAGLRLLAAVIGMDSVAPGDVRFLDWRRSGDPAGADRAAASE